MWDSPKRQPNSINAMLFMLKSATIMRMVPLQKSSMESQVKWKNSCWNGYSSWSLEIRKLTSKSKSSNLRRRRRHWRNPWTSLQISSIRRKLQSRNSRCGLFVETILIFNELNFVAVNRCSKLSTQWKTWCRFRIHWEQLDVKNSIINLIFTSTKRNKRFSW